VVKKTGTTEIAASTFVVSMPTDILEQVLTQISLYFWPPDRAELSLINRQFKDAVDWSLRDLKPHKCPKTNAD
jgi:hypothetical protein